MKFTMAPLNGFPGTFQLYNLTGVSSTYVSEPLFNSGGAGVVGEVSIEIISAAVPIIAGPARGGAGSLGSSLQKFI
jgi:hypothetical protein